MGERVITQIVCDFYNKRCFVPYEELEIYSISYMVAVQIGIFVAKA